MDFYNPMNSMNLSIYYYIAFKKLIEIYIRS